jgi:DNA-binding protein H-NS
MKSKRWKSMSIDELWIIHEEITAILSDKIGAEKIALKERLRKPVQPGSGKKLDRLADRSTTKTK